MINTQIIDEIKMKMDKLAGYQDIMIKEKILLFKI